ncbi:MAG: GDP-mannose 4,6-dehydratase [Chloroflexi bacterium]|nr:GDP-mannose 4,6-dehydratase [Chloroflexota bacterium]MBU1662008.1 GDP-mannose 4,6-dehydratase [Chloroflexota bacterium]
MTEKFLVTGGAGFTGSHLCEKLVHNGHHVVAIDDLSTGRLENIQHLRPLPNFQFVRETITNLQVLDHLTSEADIVVHR